MLCVKRESDFDQQTIYKLGEKSVDVKVRACHDERLRFWIAPARTKAPFALATLGVITYFTAITVQCMVCIRILCTGMQTPYESCMMYRVTYSVYNILAR